MHPSVIIFVKKMKGETCGKYSIAIFLSIFSSVTMDRQSNDERTPFNIRLTCSIRLHCTYLHVQVSDRDQAQIKNFTYRTVRQRCQPGRPLPFQGTASLILVTVEITA